MPHLRSTTPPLDRLFDLAQFLNAETQLTVHLKQLARLAADATRASSCSIMLVAEEGVDRRLKLWAATEILPDAAWEDRPALGESIGGKVLESGSPLLLTNVHESELGELARYRDKNQPLGDSLICVPVSIGDAPIGVINFCSQKGAPPFSESDLLVAGIAAALIAKSVQVDRMHTLLQSRFAQAALAKVEKEVTHKLTDGSTPPARVAKLLAKSFYKDLSSAGFEPAQIIEAASEMITHITADMARFRKRIARDTSNPSPNEQP